VNLLRDIALHPLSGDGYQFWSGIGGATVGGLIVAALIAVAVWFWPERCSSLNCHRRADDLHPQHGRPVCTRHMP
jgi:hypothetical protein